MQLPTVEWFGIVIAEPTTMLTDFAITATAWSMCLRMLAEPASRAILARRHWGVAFLFIGLGALLGGISHGFAPHLDAAADAAVWKATVYSVGLSSFFAVAGTVRGTPLSDRTATLVGWLNVAALVFYAAWMAEHDAFKYVIYHYVPSMLAVATLKIRERLSFGARDASWIVAGVLVTFAGAAIQQSDFDLHRHFNHNDIFHVVQIAGLFLFYRGVRGLEDAGGSLSRGARDARRA